MAAASVCLNGLWAAAEVGDSARDAAGTVIAVLRGGEVLPSDGPRAARPQEGDQLIMVRSRGRPANRAWLGDSLRVRRSCVISDRLTVLDLLAVHERGHERPILSRLPVGYPPLLSPR